jgi:hypothetical protein
MDKRAVFQCPEVEQVPEDRERVHQGEPIGKAVALRLVELLRSFGIVAENPIAGELSWFLYFPFEGSEGEIVVSWAIPMDRDEDFWAVYCQAKSSLWRRLTRRGDDAVLSEKLETILRDILAGEEKKGILKNLEWMPEEEFLKRFAS